MAINLLDAETERKLIIRAQRGDEQAMLDLRTAYMPALRAAARRFEEMLGEDAMQEADLCFIGIVYNHDFDKAQRLSQRIKDELSHALKQAATMASSQFTIPQRTQTRFLNAVRKADGDMALAVEYAQEFGLSRDTFYALYEVLRGVTHLDAYQGDGATPISPDRFVDIETKTMVDMAFRAVSTEEASVLEDHCGFTGEPVPIAEIAHKRGVSRKHINEVKNRGLNKMRREVGAIA